MRINKVIAFITALVMILSISACGGKTAGPDNVPPAAVDVPGGANTPPPPDQPDGAKTAPPPDQSGGAKTPPPPDANGPEFTAEAGAKLVVWENKGEQVLSDDFVKEFADKYGVEVIREEVELTEQGDRLTQEGASAADVVMLSTRELGKAVEAGLVLPNDTFEVETRSNNVSPAVQGVSYKRTLYGYPLAAETYLLYYNKTLLQEAPKSFEDVIEFSKKFTDKSKERYGLIWDIGNLYYSYPFLVSSGGYIYGQDGTDINDIGLNSPEAQKSMEILARLKEVLPVKTDKITKDFKGSLFTSDKLAMDMNDLSVLGEYKKAMGENLGVAPIPVIGKYNAISFSEIKAYYVNAKSQYPNAARLFAHFASTKEMQLQHSERTGDIPTNKEAQASDQIKNDPYLSVFAEQLNTSHAVPSLPEMDNVWEPVGAALTEIWDNDKDIKAALDDAVKQIKERNIAKIAK